MRVLEDLKQGLEDVWETMTEGWQRLRQQTEGALTKFKVSENQKLSGQMRHDIDRRSARWALLASDVFEDDHKVSVRIEMPGMDKADLKIEVLNDVLVVQGEKQFRHDYIEGRFVALQCAYGAFVRRVPLPAAVKADEAVATYRDGVLQIDLPKDESVRARSININVN